MPSKCVFLNVWFNVYASKIHTYRQKQLSRSFILFLVLRSNCFSKLIHKVNIFQEVCFVKRHRFYCNFIITFYIYTHMCEFLHIDIFANFETNKSSKYPIHLKMKWWIWTGIMCSIRAQYRYIAPKHFKSYIYILINSAL